MLLHWITKAVPSVQDTDASCAARAVARVERLDFKSGPITPCQPIPQQRHVFCRWLPAARCRAAGVGHIPPPLKHGLTRLDHGRAHVVPSTREPQRARIDSPSAARKIVWWPVGGLWVRVHSGRPQQGPSPSGAPHPHFGSQVSAKQCANIRYYKVDSLQNSNTKGLMLSHT
jgi:hypothetical protein